MWSAGVVHSYVVLLFDAVNVYNGKYKELQLQNLVHYVWNAIDLNANIANTLRHIIAEFNLDSETIWVVDYWLKNFPQL